MIGSIPPTFVPYGTNVGGIQLIQLNKVGTFTRMNDSERRLKLVVSEPGSVPFKNNEFGCSVKGRAFQAASA